MTKLKVEELFDSPEDEFPECEDEDIEYVKSSKVEYVNEDDEPVEVEPIEEEEEPDED